MGASSFPGFAHRGRANEVLGSANTPGICHLCFQVDDLDGTVNRLREHGAELVGEIQDYGDIYRLRYVRGPDDIIIELVQRIG